MKTDESGVTGFFEDLPVVIVVLAGTMVLMLSISWATCQTAEKSTQEALQADASQTMDLFLLHFAPDAPSGQLPTLSHFRTLNVSNWGLLHIESACFALSLALIHPQFEFLGSAECSGHASSACGFSFSYLNVLTDDGLKGILKVTVIVWKG